MWNPRWVRGFVESVITGRVALFRYGERLFASQPITRITPKPSDNTFLRPHERGDEPYCWNDESTREGQLMLAWGREQAGLQPLPGGCRPDPSLVRPSRWPWSHILKS